MRYLICPLLLLVSVVQASADLHVGIVGVVVHVQEEIEGAGWPVEGATVHVDGAKMARLYDIDFRDEINLLWRKQIASAKKPRETDAMGRCIVYAYGSGAGNRTALSGTAMVKKEGYESVKIDFGKIDHSDAAKRGFLPEISVKLRKKD